MLANGKEVPPRYYSDLTYKWIDQHATLVTQGNITGHEADTLEPTTTAASLAIAACEQETASTVGIPDYEHAA